MTDYYEPETDPVGEASAPDLEEIKADNTEEISVPEHDEPSTYDSEETSVPDGAEPDRSDKFGKITKNKYIGKADGALNKVTGVVADKAGPKKKLVAFAIIGIALVLVIAVVAVVVLGGGSSDNRSLYEPDVFDDPVIQGSLGIGTVFTYSVGGSDSVNLEIVGQSGSYYLLDVGTLSAHIDNDTQYQMFHKTTAGLRFGTQTGTDTYTYDGKEIKLNLWTVIDSNDDIWTLGASPSDGIPYKIKAVCDEKIVEGKLTGIKKLSPSTYAKSSSLDKYYVYSLGGSIDGSSATGVFDAGVAAEASGTYWSAFVIDANVDGHGKYRQTEYYRGSDLVQLLYDEFTVLGEATLSGQVKLTTIDGDKTCNVYKLNLGGSVVLESLIEPTSKIVYKSTLNDGGDNYTLTLKQKHV